MLRNNLEKVKALRIYLLIQLFHRSFETKLLSKRIKLKIVLICNCSLRKIFRRIIRNFKNSGAYNSGIILIGIK